MMYELLADSNNFYQGIGDVGAYNCLRTICSRGFESEIFDIERFLLIVFRSVLAPIMATSFYSNVLYHLQQKYMYSLSETLTQVDPLAASRYSQSLVSNLSQGHRYEDAVQLATSSLYSTLQQQSLLLALKEIFGWLFVVTLVIAVVSRFIPFHKTIRVTFTKTGDDMV